MKSTFLLKIHFVFFFFLAYYSCFGTVFTSVEDGDWDKASVWDQNAVPSANDTVVIDGYTIDIDDNTGNVTVKYLLLTNATDEGDSKLNINGSAVLNVSGNFDANFEDEDSSVELKVANGAILNVSGHFTFTRFPSTQDDSFSMKISETSRVNISGTFTFDYQDNSSEEDSKEISLEDDAVLQVAGNAQLYMKGGEELKFEIKNESQVLINGNLDVEMTGGEKVNIKSKNDAHFQVTGNVTINNSGSKDYVKIHPEGDNGQFTIGGDLVMNSTAINKIVKVEATKEHPVLNVGGNVVMNALSEEDVFIELKNESNFYVGGNFLRPNNFGSLMMSSDATLTYNGTQPQAIPAENLDGSGADNFSFTNVVLNNSSGFAISDTTIIDDYFELSAGKITTSHENILIIEDNATIIGGNATAYIDGPVLKRGRTNGTDFTFPVGSGDTYAPLQISSIGDQDAEIKVQYFSEPPPFGNDNTNYESGLEAVSSQGYWDVERNAEAGTPDYTLFWENSQAIGIEELSSLVVVGLDNTTWRSYGQERSSFDGAGGSITSAYSEPPPFGIEFLSIGSTSASSKLPVELTRFTALSGDRTVHLNWQTASEVNSSHFEVERSADGITFERLTSVMTKGSSSSVTDYDYKDLAPGNGWNYYRLKIVDYDESFEYSNIEVVKFEESASLKIYPNPVSDRIAIRGNEWTNEDFTLEVYDQYGKFMYKNHFKFGGGIFEIDTEEVNILEQGTYFIKIIAGSKSSILKVIKTEL
ncbi:MAG: T9SS type A sorting domain-containing protein [Bacteroidota bacterium]